MPFDYIYRFACQLGTRPVRHHPDFNPIQTARAAQNRVANLAL